MNWFTVEVTLKSVDNDDWSPHLSAVDAVPGTMLIQDPGAPVLTFPVDSESVLKASRFVEGVLTIIGLRAVSMHVADMPECDFEVEEDDPDESVILTTVEQRVTAWMRDTPDVADGPNGRELVH